MKCAECGAEFEPNKYHLNSQKYCSQKCRRRSEYKIYRATHRAEINDYGRKYYREHREENLQRQKEYRWRKAGD